MSRGPEISRRSVLKLLAAGLMGPWDTASRAASDGPMRMREIPVSGERLPVIGLGTSDEFEIEPSSETGALREVLRRFQELGGTIVDTAPIYGNAEAVIGGLVQGG